MSAWTTYRDSGCMSFRKSHMCSLALLDRSIDDTVSSSNGVTQNPPGRCCRGAPGVHRARAVMSTVSLQLGESLIISRNPSQSLTISLNPSQSLTIPHIGAQRANAMRHCVNITGTHNNAQAQSLRHFTIEACTITHTPRNPSPSCTIPHHPSPLLTIPSPSLTTVNILHLTIPHHPSISRLTIPSPSLTNPHNSHNTILINQSLTFSYNPSQSLYR